MQERPDVRKVERVPLAVLMQQVRNYTEENPFRSGEVTISKRWETGKRLRTCSVYDFYEPFLIKRRADEEEIRDVQEWIADSIEVMVGERDIDELTMEDLAGRITRAINKDGLAYGDRWALYELCFMLVLQMCVLRDEFFSIEEQSIRWGTPDETETGSLCRRVSALRVAKEASKDRTAPVARVSLEKLLRMARGSSHKLTEKTRLSLPNLSASPVTHCLLAAKYNVRDDVREDMLLLMEKTQRFEEMFRMYTGEELEEGSSISELAAAMTWKFKLEAESCFVSRAYMLQTYELCYEFISLLADAECDNGHVPLMERDTDEERSTTWTEHQT